MRVVSCHNKSFLTKDGDTCLKTNTLGQIIPSASSSFVTSDKSLSVDKDEGFLGLENPVILDLSVMKITFALMFKISISSIIGMILAVFIYRKV